MTFPQTKAFAILVGAVGVIFFSAKAVMVKLAYEYGVGAVELLLFRMLFALPFYVAIAFIKKPLDTKHIKKSDYLWIIFFGFIGYYLASYFDFLGLKYIKASMERIILFIYPTLVLIISRIFLKKKITSPQIIAIVITYVGIVITFYEELEISGQGVLLGGTLVFFSALTYATYLAGSGWLIPKFGATTFTSYAMIVSCLSVIVHYLIFIRTDLSHYDLEVYALALLMALLSTVIPSYLVSMAIKQLGAPNFSIIGSLGPISTIILANIFLEEQMTFLQIIGTAIVISGIIVISRSKKISVTKT
ncbi:MAG: DMT family transporter [Bacteroidota bacterium]